ncbi:hypothetical protein [Neptunomonas concharum]|uniref:Uncharacterized protein n=1 Tax=Neptunomonas concharum TaxID=1031538 RepID=A0A5P1RAJ8_9GAMM|nr:hypothetical protein [Neptunomonas concharum]QEQ96669.1 hypothetical protein F0U83_08040 [Neptunomonas concharum]
MSSKEHLIRFLEELTQELRESENTDESIYRTIRRFRVFSPFLDDEFEYRLHSIEKKIDSLIDRPVASCRMASSDGERVTELMMGHGPLERAKGVKYLSDWMNSPTEITIADPYFIKNSGSIPEADYKNSLQGLLPLSLKKIELFIGPRTQKYHKASIATWFNQLCTTRGIQLEVFHQEEVHDRVWLRDGGDALVVGTSFNGLGNKCAFLLNLDAADTASFNAELSRIRAEYTCSNQV